MTKLPTVHFTVSPLISVPRRIQKRKPILTDRWVVCNFPTWTSSPQDCLWQPKNSSVTFIWRTLFLLQQEAKTTSKHTSPSEATDLGLRWRLGHVTWKRNPNGDINCCLNCFLFCSSQTSQFFEESHDVIPWAEYKYCKSNSAPTSSGHGSQGLLGLPFCFQVVCGCECFTFLVFPRGLKTLLFLFENERKKTWRISHRLE